MTLYKLNFKYFFMNKKRVVENNWKKINVLKSLSKAVGPWKQKPQTRTSWTDFLQLTEEQMDQTADKKKKKYLIVYGREVAVTLPSQAFPIIVGQGRKLKSIIISSSFTTSFSLFASECLL